MKSKKKRRCPDDIANGMTLASQTRRGAGDCLERIENSHLAEKALHALGGKRVLRGCETSGNDGRWKTCRARCAGFGVDRKQCG